MNTRSSTASENNGEGQTRVTLAEVQSQKASLISGLHSYCSSKAATSLSLSFLRGRLRGGLHPGMT